MLVDMLGELSNSATFFSSFCNIRTGPPNDKWKEAKNIYGSIGESGSRAVWTEWSYNDHLASIKHLESKKNIFIFKNKWEPARDFITKTLKDFGSCQELLPPLGKELSEFVEI